MVVLDLFNIQKELTIRNNIFEESEFSIVSHILKWGILNTLGPEIKQIK